MTYVSIIILPVHVSVLVLKYLNQKRLLDENECVYFFRETHLETSKQSILLHHAKTTVLVTYELLPFIADKV